MPLFSDRHIIDEKMKQALENHSVTPPQRVWWRISNAAIHNKRTSSKRILFLAAALLFISSSIGVYEIIHHRHQRALLQAPPEGTAPVLKPATTSEASGAKKDVVLSYPPAAGKQQPTKGGMHLLQHDPVNIPSATMGITLISTGNEDMKSLPVRDPELRRIPGLIRHIDVPGRTIVHTTVKYYLGIVATMNSTWLLDRSALKSENLKYEPTFGASYGIQGAYIINRHWAVNAAWIINSWEGQQYKNLDLYGRTTDLDYNRKSIALTYMQLPVILQYRIPKYSRLFNMPMAFNLNAGASYGRLLSVRFDQEKDELQTNALVRRSQVAAVAGFSYDFMVNRPVFYSLGLQASFSGNLFNHNVPNYYEFDSPHSFLLGIRGAVNFGMEK